MKPTTKHDPQALGNKLIAVVGPTASGKSELAVTIAKKYNGEIISCDSRQIYTGMDIGTGKVPGKWIKSKFIYKSIPHYCIDFVDPNKQFSVAKFQKTAAEAIEDIIKRGKLPILCGGTGHWVDSVIKNEKIPEVKPNNKLRKELEKLSLPELFEKLQLLDPDRAAVIDAHNPRRLIRALEIVITTGKPVPKLSISHSPFQVLTIGIYPGQDALYEKIDKRLLERMNQGMIEEIKHLHEGKQSNIKPLSYQRLESFGLEYKYISLFLQKKLSKEETIEQLSFAIKHYAKRQMTWFRKNETTCWIQNPKEADPLVKDFIS